MPRPRKSRLVSSIPEVSYFKPRGVPLKNLVQVSLTLEGYEALRLADLEGLEHEEAAAAMGVSRQTFGRVLAEARHTVAEAVVMGRALSIEGGHYQISDQPARCDSVQGAPLPETGSAATAGGKIGVSSAGPGLDSLVTPRFGRAAGFVVVDPANLHYQFLDNASALERGQGAGIQTAEALAKAGVSVVLTGFVGPKAFEALRAAGIGIVLDLDGMSARQAVERFLAGQAKLAEGPNRRG